MTRDSSMIQSILLIIFFTSTMLNYVHSFSMKQAGSKEIYNIPNSGWSSPKWNWGYASGTGHDCAMICRQRYASKEARMKLVDALINPLPIQQGEGEENTLLSIDEVDSRRDPPFEEVKLILGLVWQNGRWDGTDGGAGGYGEVLSAMAACKYESSNRGNDDDQKTPSSLFVKDMVQRFGLIANDENDDDDMAKMKCLETTESEDVDCLRRKVAGLVLKNMNFVDRGV